MNIWSSEVITCLGFSFFNVSRSIQQRGFLRLAAVGSVWQFLACYHGFLIAVTDGVLTGIPGPPVRAFSLNSSFQSTLLTRIHTYTQITVLWKGKGKAHFCFTKMKYMNRNFCVCVDN